MMKEVLRAMETGLLAEIGLVSFFVVFVLIMIRAVVIAKNEGEYAKNIPLQDDPSETKFSTNHR